MVSPNRIARSEGAPYRKCSALSELTCLVYHKVIRGATSFFSISEIPISNKHLTKRRIPYGVFSGNFATKETLKKGPGSALYWTQTRHLKKGVPLRSLIPPEQGIFPVVEAVRKFKASGKWNGWIVSEGHEEEKFGANRILLKTWEAFGSPIYRTGMQGAPQRWNDVQQGYFGNTYPPYFITQSYVPVNDFKLWSEVQLE